MVTVSVNVLLQLYIDVLKHRAVLISFRSNLVLIGLNRLSW